MRGRRAAASEIASAALIDRAGSAPYHPRSRDHAQVAELVDALASGASSRMGVEVRVFSWAPYFSNPPSHLFPRIKSGALVGRDDSPLRLHQTLETIAKLLQHCVLVFLPCLRGRCSRRERRGHAAVRDWSFSPHHFFLFSFASAQSILPRIKSGVRAGGRPCEPFGFETGPSTRTILFLILKPVRAFGRDVVLLTKRRVLETVAKPYASWAQVFLPRLRGRCRRSRRRGAAVRGGCFSPPFF